MEDEHLLLLKSYEQTLEASLQLVKHQIRKHEEYLTMAKELKAGSNNNYPEVLTAEEIADILKVSTGMAYKIMERKDFPLIRINSNKRVQNKAFFEWLAIQTIKK